MNKRLKKKNGLSKITNEELNGLDFTLAKYILPRLIRFKDYNTMGHPSNFKNQEEWHNTIDKMIYSFKYVIDNNYKNIFKNTEEDKLNYEKYKEGMTLFAEYFMDLWD